MLEDDISDLMEPEAAIADAIVAAHPPAQFHRRDDPSLPHYPRGLILDLALRTAPVADILQAYKITSDEFKLLVEHPVFRRDMRDMQSKLQDEGYSFKVKVQAQSEAYLQQVWKMVHDPETPASVRADLIKSTIKWSGLEPKPEPASSQVAINLDLRNISNEDLNARVMNIVMKKAGNPLAAP